MVFDELLQRQRLATDDAANRFHHFAGEPAIRHNLSRGALMRDQPIGRAALPHGLLRTLERHAHIGDLAAQGLREDIGEFRETALGPGEFVNLARVRLRIEKNAGPAKLRSRNQAARRRDR